RDHRSRLAQQTGYGPSQKYERKYRDDRGVFPNPDARSSFHRFVFADLPAAGATTSNVVPMRSSSKSACSFAKRDPPDPICPISNRKSLIGPFTTALSSGGSLPTGGSIKSAAISSPARKSKRVTSNRGLLSTGTVVSQPLAPGAPLVTRPR